LANTVRPLFSIGRAKSPTWSKQTASIFIPPCIPTLVDKPPESDRWSHEIKYDGYRTQLHLTGGHARAFTRNGHDWSIKYASVLACARELISRDAVLDGEIVVQDERGRSNFKKPATAIRWQESSLFFYAFDLLCLDGNDLRKQRCEDRRQRLHELVGNPLPTSSIQFSQSLVGSGSTSFATVEKMGFEGIVSKRKASTYRGGTTKDWLKTKAYISGEFVVIGYERKRGAALSLLLAEETEACLRHVGRAIPAIAPEQHEELMQALEVLHASAFATPIGGGNKGAVPVQPVLKVMAMHLRGEEKLHQATVTALHRT